MFKIFEKEEQTTDIHMLKLLYDLRTYIIAFY